MKKAVLWIMFSLLCLCGCANNNQNNQNNNEKAPAHKIGVGSITTISTKDATTDKEGYAKISTTYAMVVLAEDGKLVQVKIDTAENSGYYDSKGVANSELSVAQDTKKERMDAYGMKEISGIKKEWYEQMKALEEWMVGKTPDEVSRMALENDKPAEEDLKSSVTISVSDYLKAVAKAVANAEELN